MDMTLQTRWTEHWEGRRAFAYDDKTGKRIMPGVPLVGKPTIGVGCNLATMWAKLTLSGMGLDFDYLASGQGELNDAEIDGLLSRALAKAYGGARALFPDLDQYETNQQLVIVDLTFNMGVGTLATFHKTIAAIKAQNWQQASVELANSDWYRQVGDQPNQRGWSNVHVLGNMIDPAAILPAQV
ncbi:hypothetical protein DYQ86_15955 [Acidobacteria bacterium AB60]|nr:hypothetical protein DYQ86_15955 [Acidobacteria bacterium AB60]